MPDRHPSPSRLPAVEAMIGQQSRLLATPDGWMGWLDVAGRFPGYSLDNQLAILAQDDPPLTQLASFERWKAVGRTVSKGQHAIWLKVPDTIGLEATLPDGTTRILSGIADATPEETVVMRPLTHKAVPVFDVAQTTGQALDANPPMTLTGLYDALTSYLVRRFDDGDRIRDYFLPPDTTVDPTVRGALGLASITARRILPTTDGRQSQAQAIFDIVTRSVGQYVLTQAGIDPDAYYLADLRSRFIPNTAIYPQDSSIPFTTRGLHHPINVRDARAAANQVLDIGGLIVDEALPARFDPIAASVARDLWQSFTASPDSPVAAAIAAQQTSAATAQAAASSPQPSTPVLPVVPLANGSPMRM